VVGVQLPEAAVKHIKVLVGEVLPDLVDVFLSANLLEHLKQVRFLEVSPRYSSVVVCVKPVDDAHHHCVCVTLLKLWGLLEELEAWMLFEQVLEHGLEVVTDNCIRPVLRYHLKEAPLRLLFLEIIRLPKSLQQLLVGFGLPTELGEPIRTSLLLQARKYHV
jgi:hypothetical protein